MSFLAIRIETPDGPAAIDPNRAHSLRKIVASILELELKRDFEAVTVVQHDDPPTLVLHVRSPFDRTKLSEVEQAFLADLNTMLADSPYRIDTAGGVVRRDNGVELTGVGIDWRAVLGAVNKQGAGMLPGIIASVIDAAEEYERHEQQRAPRN